MHCLFSESLHTTAPPIDAPAPLKPQSRRSTSIASLKSRVSATLQQEVRDTAGSAEVTMIANRRISEPESDAGSVISFPSEYSEEEEDPASEDEPPPTPNEFEEEGSVEDQEEYEESASEDSDESDESTDREDSTPSAPTQSPMQRALSEGGATTTSSHASVMCGQSLFVTNIDCDLQLTISTGFIPKVLLR